MPDPPPIRRRARLTGFAGLAVGVAVLVACSSGATTPPTASNTASPLAIATQALSASPSDGAQASPAPSVSASGSASPSASSTPGRYVADATPTPKPTVAPTPTAKPTTKPTPKPTPKPVSIVVKSHSTGIGKVLVGPNGMTLYTLKSDPTNGSGCTGGCADNWPPFLVKNGTVVKGGSGMTGTFATFARSGKRQVTYKGRALYYYVGDAYAGDTNGQGAGNVWYVAKP